jgi:hypothetical protein
VHLVPLLRTKKLDAITNEVGAPRMARCEQKVRRRTWTPARTLALFAARVTHVCSQPAGHRHVPQNSPGTKISRRRSGTCTSVPRRSTAQSVCLTPQESAKVLEIFWRREIARRRSLACRTR